MEFLFYNYLEQIFKKLMIVGKGKKKLNYLHSPRSPAYTGRGMFREEKKQNVKKKIFFKNIRDSFQSAPVSAGGSLHHLLTSLHILKLISSSPQRVITNTSISLVLEGAVVITGHLKRHQTGKYREGEGLSNSVVIWMRINTYTRMFRPPKVFFFSFYSLLLNIIVGKFCVALRDRNWKSIAKNVVQRYRFLYSVLHLW